VKTAREALARMLAGVDELADAERRFQAEVDKQTSRELALSTAEAEVWALKTDAGTVADRDGRSAHEKIQSFGIAALALLVHEYMSLGDDLPAGVS
jgi:hypothetical protein